MCSRHAEPGAGHPDWLPRPFRVVMEDDDHGRHNVIIRAAVGIHDALNQARELHPYDSPLTAEALA